MIATVRVIHEVRIEGRRGEVKKARRFLEERGFKFQQYVRCLEDQSFWMLGTKTVKLRKAPRCRDCGKGLRPAPTRPAPYHLSDGNLP